MRELSAQVLTSFDLFVLVFIGVLNSTYLLLLCCAGFDLVRQLGRSAPEGHDDLFTNPLTPGISVVVPAYNEEAVIVESVRAMLNLRYPSLEIVVVDDGSTDATFALLQQAYDLVEIPKVVPNMVPSVGAVRSVHVPRGDRVPLVVVRKDNARRRADPLNVGICVASQPLVCLTDADSLLEPESLLHMVRPFVDEPEQVVAVGGSIRPVNDAPVYRGELAATPLPRRWLPRIQVVEYLRSFLMGRCGWARLNGLIIISGAFGLFDREVLIEVGGLDPRCIGEDAELVTRLHHRLRTHDRPYRIRFVPEAVCWTEVPETLRGLRAQRRRWAQGMGELLWRHRGMIGNPRYGMVGVASLPHFLCYELLGPVVEAVGLVAVIAGLAFGLVDIPFAILFALIAFGFGFLLSVAALALEEFSVSRYPSWRDLGAFASAAIVETTLFRPLHAWWRLEGLWRAMRGGDAVWETPPRAGFCVAAPAAGA